MHCEIFVRSLECPQWTATDTNLKLVLPVLQFKQLFRSVLWNKVIRIENAEPFLMPKTKKRNI